MDLQTIPESFLGRVLKEFGLQWTHLFIISGVVVSAFGLDAYIDSSIWILGVVGAFCFVYIFNDYISGRFLLTFSLCVAAFGLAMVPFALAPGHPVAEWFATVLPNKGSRTLYWAFAVGAPLGVCLISYRRRESVRLLPLPDALRANVTEQVLQAVFLIERALYEIHLEKTEDGRVRFFFDLRFSILNRSTEPAEYRDVFDPTGDLKEFYVAELGGRVVDVASPENRFGRGLVLSHRAAGRARFEVHVAGSSVFSPIEAELVGTYYPAVELEVTIRKPPDDLQVSTQCLLKDNVEPHVRANGDRVLAYTQGLLPYQGIRVH